MGDRGLAQMPALEAGSLGSLVLYGWLHDVPVTFTLGACTSLPESGSKTQTASQGFRAPLAGVRVLVLEQ